MTGSFETQYCRKVTESFEQKEITEQFTYSDYLD